MPDATLPWLRPFGIDFFCLGRKFLVFNMVSRNLKIKYRRSVLGLFWTLVNPLAMTAVYYFVFKVVLNVRMPNYLIFILSGILPWTFFSMTLTEGMESIVANWGLISKVPIPLQVFPYVGAITNLVTLVLSIPVIIGAAIFSHASLGPSLIMLVFFFAALFMIAYGLSLILSIAFVYLRDLRHIMGIVMQVWFYATPIVYDESMIPAKYHWVHYLNPVGQIFVGIHRVLVAGEWPSTENVFIVSGWSVVTIALTLLVQKTLCRELVEQI